jgi:hypothetical protein
VIAVLTIRDLPHYRRSAFEVGLKAAGYKIVAAARPDGPEDYLILWNHRPSTEAQAETWEACGGTVLVCENGYAGVDSAGRQYYAIGVHGHNGAGWYPCGNEDRFVALGIAVEPWRADGSHVLICGQRGIGSKQMASPPNWHTFAAQEMKKRTSRPIRIRQHPGNGPPAVPLEDDLAGAWACCIWSSSCGIRALAAGVPVFYSAPKWICAEAASRDLDSIETPGRDDAARLSALSRMAWGQRSVDEIETGEVFVRIRENAEARQW